jgi:hypothetical protein
LRLEIEPQLCSNASISGATATPEAAAGSTKAAETTA